MNRTSIAAALIAAALTATTPGSASDHVDGIKTAIDLGADITDVFTFVSPENPEKLVLMMNVHSLSNSRSRFSNAVDYVFRVRPIDDARTLTPSTDARREQLIVCSFSGGMTLVRPKQTATCKVNVGGTTETVSFETRSSAYRAGGSGERNGIRIFAGVRSDPWFLDLARTVKFVNVLPVDQTPGKNGLNGHNILSIVVEVDKHKLPGSLLAVTGHTVRK